MTSTEEALSLANGLPATTETRELPRCPTGVYGLDDITGGGLPLGRPTLVCGGAGCGKTLLALEFIVRGATEYGEPGVFISFEELQSDLVDNVRSLGFDLGRLTAEGTLRIDHVRVERSEIEETGEYDLDGLFIRIGHAIDAVGAKRLVLDTVESLFSGFSDERVLRSELRRLFQWLKERGVTAVITGERGEGGLTRQGLQEYVSDCVILLDHRIEQQRSTRRMRIVKYRGALHGTNEYPFLIDRDGIRVIPVTSLRLDHKVSRERVPSGIAHLDEMLGGGGYYRGSSVLVSGSAGSGKTSIAAHFLEAACRRGERCLLFLFEESPDQMVRNMESIGIGLRPHIESGTLVVHAARPTLTGLEAHLAVMQRMAREVSPAAVVIDPITNLTVVGTRLETNLMVTRLIDTLKSSGITTFFTSLTGSPDAPEATDIGISSLMDTWLLLRDIELGGERNRGMYVLKSRGMAHSNQIREFVLSDRGVQLAPVYLGPEGVLTGSMRLAQEAREQAAAAARRWEEERSRRELARKRAAIEAQLAVLRAELESHDEDLRKLDDQSTAEDVDAEDRRTRMARSRKQRS